MTLFPETRATLQAALRSPEDREAWEQFVITYRPVFYRMARRRGLQDADAQDVSQQVLIRISEAINRYEPAPGTRFRHWLRRIANNAISTALKRSGNRPAQVEWPDPEQLQNEAPPAELLTEELNSEYEREMYLQAASIVRGEVSAETWRAFELTMIDNLTCDEAATLLGKSTGTVYAARSRIVRRLRRQIERLRQTEEN